MFSAPRPAPVKRKRLLMSIIGQSLIKKTKKEKAHRISKAEESMDNMSLEEKVLYECFIAKAWAAFLESDNAMDVYVHNHHEIFKLDPIKRVFKGNIKWQKIVKEKYNFLKTSPLTKPVTRKSLWTCGIRRSSSRSVANATNMMSGWEGF